MMKKDIHTLLEELESALLAVESESLVQFIQMIHEAPRIFVAGKGRSGLQMRAFAMRLMHLGLCVFVVDDVTTPALESGDLLIIGSGSGRTPALVNYAQKATSNEARLALITTSPDSPIAQQADYCVTIPVSSPKIDDNTNTIGKSVLPMGSLFEHSMGLLLELVIVQLMRDTGQSSEEMFKRHANLE